MDIMMPVTSAYYSNQSGQISSVSSNITQQPLGNIVSSPVAGEMRQFGSVSSESIVDMTTRDLSVSSGLAPPVNMPTPTFKQPAVSSSIVPVSPVSPVLLPSFHVSSTPKITTTGFSASNISSSPINYNANIQQRPSAIVKLPTIQAMALFNNQNELRNIIRSEAENDYNQLDNAGLIDLFVDTLKDKKMGVDSEISGLQSIEVEKADSILDRVLYVVAGKTSSEVKSLGLTSNEGYPQQGYRIGQAGPKEMRVELDVMTPEVVMPMLDQVKSKAEVKEWLIQQFSVQRMAESLPKMVGEENLQAGVGSHYHHSRAEDYDQETAQAMEVYQISTEFYRNILEGMATDNVQLSAMPLSPSPTSIVGHLQDYRRVSTGKDFTSKQKGIAGQYHSEERVPYLTKSARAFVETAVVTAKMNEVNRRVLEDKGYREGIKKDVLTKTVVKMKQAGNLTDEQIKQKVAVLDKVIGDDAFFPADFNVSYTKDAGAFKEVLEASYEVFVGELDLPESMSSRALAAYQEYNATVDKVKSLSANDSTQLTETQQSLVSAVNNWANVSTLDFVQAINNKKQAIDFSGIQSNLSAQSASSPVSIEQAKQEFNKAVRSYNEAVESGNRLYDVRPIVKGMAAANRELNALPTSKEKTEISKKINQGSQQMLLEGIEGAPSVINRLGKAISRDEYTPKGQEKAQVQEIIEMAAVQMKQLEAENGKAAVANIRRDFNDSVRSMMDKIEVSPEVKKDIRLSSYEQKNPAMYGWLTQAINEVDEAANDAQGPLSHGITYVVKGGKIYTDGTKAPHATFMNEKNYPELGGLKTGGADYIGYMRVGKQNGKLVLAVDKGSNTANSSAQLRDFSRKIGELKRVLNDLGIQAIVSVNGRGLEADGTSLNGLRAQNYITDAPTNIVVSSAITKMAAGDVLRTQGKNLWANPAVQDTAVYLSQNGLDESFQRVEKSSLPAYMEVYEKDGIQIIRKELTRENANEIRQLAQAQRQSNVPVFFAKGDTEHYYEVNLAPEGYTTAYQVVRNSPDRLAKLAEIQPYIMAAADDGLRFDNSQWFVHNHLHPKNIMIKQNDAGEIEDVKFIDWKKLSSFNPAAKPETALLQQGDQNALKGVKVEDVGLEWFDFTDYDLSGTDFTKTAKIFGSYVDQAKTSQETNVPEMEVGLNFVALVPAIPANRKDATPRLRGGIQSSPVQLTQKPTAEQFLAIKQAVAKSDFFKEKSIVSIRSNASEQDKAIYEDGKLNVNLNNFDLKTVNALQSSMGVGVEQAYTEYATVVYNHEKFHRETISNEKKQRSAQPRKSGDYTQRELQGIISEARKSEDDNIRTAVAEIDKI
ncbi:MAG TPA: hypothetical protein PLD92_07750, partial [Candidatus Omnitrophota bacterium]|nr:hypothetical protein [Candidatus Omnitrophota bacterium]